MEKIVGTHVRRAREEQGPVLVAGAKRNGAERDVGRAGAGRYPFLLTA